MDGAPQIDITYVATGREGHALLTVHMPDGTVHTDSFKIVSARARGKFADAIAERAPAADRDAVLAALDGVAAAMADDLARQGSGEGCGVEQPDAAALLAAMPEEARAEARDMLNDPYLIRRIVEDIETLGVAGERELTATIYLIGTSRLLPRPLAGIVQGPTASGKSYQVERVAALFPPEAVIHATQMTPQALFHMPPGAMVHKFVVAGERSRAENPEAAEATRALREMLSSGRLSKLMPVKVGGEVETRRIEQEGPIAFVESTTLMRIFEEDANRCLLLHTDERAEQTRRIYRAVAEGYSGARRQDEIDKVALRHHAAQRLLERGLGVVIPYAPDLAEIIAADRVEGRRAFGHLLGAIAASAFLHQFQRTRDEHGALVATEVDYQIAKRLLDQPLAQLLGRRVSAAAERFRERLVQRFGGDEFSTRDACAGESVTDRHVRDWLKALCDAGHLDQTEPSRGSLPARWKPLPVDPDDDGGADLPAVEVVFPALEFRPSGNAQVPAAAGAAPEAASGTGNVPAGTAAEPEPSRQCGRVPANGPYSQGDALAGTPEVVPGGDL